MISFEPPLRLDDFSILFLGRSGLNVNVTEHLHGGYYEISVITSGSGKMYTAGIPAKVRKGDVYVSFPFDIHKVESDGESPLSYDFVTFSANSFRFSDKLNNLWNNNISPDTRVFHSEEILGIVDSIIAEFDDNYKNTRLLSTEMISALCNQMVVFLLRKLKNDTESGSSINKSHSELCLKIMNYIDTNIYTIKSLDEIASSLGYNYSYLSALFRKTTSTSISFYYRAKRLETARLLMSERKMSISSISDVMGYSSIYAFSKSFKAYYGVSPREYLKQS